MGQAALEDRGVLQNHEVQVWLGSIWTATPPVRCIFGVKKRTTRGALRFLILGFLAFTLAFWQALEMVTDWGYLDWGAVAQAAADNLLLDVQLLVAVREVERLKAILVARGIAC